MLNREHGAVAAQFLYISSETTVKVALMNLLCPKYDFAKQKLISII